MVLPINLGNSTVLLLYFRVSDYISDFYALTMGGKDFLPHIELLLDLKFYAHYNLQVEISFLVKVELIC